MERSNKLGSIKINNSIIAQAVLDGIKASHGKAKACDENMKILGEIDLGRFDINSGVSAKDLAQAMIIEDNEDEYRIEFFIVTKFGFSISKITTGILDTAERYLAKILLDKPFTLVVNVIGVKSKSVFPTKVVYERKHELQ